MTAPRILGYDDLYGWAEARLDDAYGDGQQAEDDADEGGQRFHAGRASAFNDLIAHIEIELRSAR